LSQWLRGAGRKEDAPSEATKRREVPMYARLLSTPTRRMPADLLERERGPEHARHREWLLAHWQERPVPPEEAIVLFTLVSGPRGFVAMPLPDGARAALYFTSPMRAMDYRECVDLQGDGAKFMSLTLSGFLKMLRDIDRMGVRHLILDRCPRCHISVVITAASIQDTSAAWRMIGIQWANALARQRTFTEYARETARSGLWDVARDVALEAVGHVNLESEELHLLIGNIGVATSDSILAGEALNFLRVLRADAEAGLLQRAIESGRADLESASNGGA
jgi:hypothetical protein